MDNHTNNHMSDVKEVSEIEEWRKVPIAPFEEKYEISNLGRVRSLYKNPPNILKASFRSKYLGVGLYNQIHKTIDIHKLVALAFVPNSNNYPIVNHKNGIKNDNRAINLEWASHSQNKKHAQDSGLTKLNTLRVSQYTKDGQFIKTFNSVKDAMEATGALDTKISGVCKGYRKSAKGFVWKYEDINWENLNIPEGKEFPGFPNYIITKDAKVYSKSHKKYLATQLNAGYECITLNSFNKETKVKTSKTISMHILMATLYLPNPDNLPYVNHKNSNRADNRLDNLEWISPSDNMKHASNSKIQKR